LSVAGASDSFDLNDFLRRYSKHSGVSYSSVIRNGSRKAMVVSDRKNQGHEQNMLDLFGETDCLPYFPVRITKGLETWRVLTAAPRSSRLLQSRLKEV
jgi:hypothetical protein